MRVHLVNVAIVCTLTLIVFGIKGMIAQTSSMDNKPLAGIASTRSEPEEVDHYLPFSVGTKWIYKVCGEIGVGSGQNVRIETKCGQYSETVVSVHTYGPTLRLIEIMRNGAGFGYALCENDEEQNGPKHYWFIVNRLSVYSRCSREDAMELVSILTNTSTHQVCKDWPDYVLPFKVGAFWGADPAGPKREDKYYQWNVEDTHAVSVPAGNFQDCYKLMYITLPDDEEKWVCAGVGLVTDEYTHHGWVNHYRIELKKYTSGSRIGTEKKLVHTK